MKHLIGLRDLSSAEILEIMTRADDISQNGSRHFQQSYHQHQTFVANLFFENSTRTRFSFEVAQKRLGLQVLNFQADVSSSQKGESLYDTLKTLEAIGVKGVVIRHEQNGVLTDVKNRLQLNLINAGTGDEEHPTQALLDLLTMKQEFGKIEQLKVAIIGDLRHSRVFHSNLYALGKLGATVLIAGPQSLMPKQEFIAKHPHCHVCTVDEAIVQADVVMMLRIQLERHRDALNITAEEYLQTYGLSLERAKGMQQHAIIMHPAPVNRNVEIASELVEARQSRIFKQMRNGVAVRMAVLEQLLL